MSTALAGGFLTTAPPGKSQTASLLTKLSFYFLKFNLLDLKTFSYRKEESSEVLAALKQACDVSKRYL